MLFDIKDYTKELKLYNTVEFKQLNNFDNYFIYEDGRIYSIKSKRFLKPNNRIDGYLNIGIFNNEKKRHFFTIHRLVYEAFKGSIPEGLEVDHINGIRNDNRLSNLRLLTQKENKQKKHCFEEYKRNDSNCYLKKKKYHKEYNKKYNDEHIEQRKELYKINKEIILQKQREYYRKNKEKKQQYNKEYYKNHREENKKKDIIIKE